ncbi:MAG: hypothetical protein ACOYKJ_06850 [Candidatus Howiella sp.]|jgi:hypothetical protein
MKKLFSICLTAALLLCFGAPAASAAERGSASNPQAEEGLSLTGSERQEIFDAWFAFLYTDYLIPANQYYDSYEAFEADQGEKYAQEKLSTENVAIQCLYKENDVYIVTVVHDLISRIDRAWLESAGGYVFNFSGVDRALWVYRDGRLYYFKDAYDAGLVSRDAIEELVQLYPYVIPAGDMDGDGERTISDVVELRAWIAAQRYYEARGDIDGDGENTVSDVVALRAAIVARA